MKAAVGIIGGFGIILVSSGLTWDFLNWSISDSPLAVYSRHVLDSLVADPSRTIAVGFLLFIGAGVAKAIAAKGEK